MLQGGRLISAIIAAAHAFDQQSYTADADRREDFYGMKTVVHDNVL